MASTRIFVLPGLLLMLALPLAGEARSLDAPKAPPTEPVYEVDPGERVGYTRVMGPWEWTGDNYMWSPGQWIAEKEGSIHVSNVMALTSTGVKTRIGYKLETSASGTVTKTRIARKNSEMLGKA